MGNKDFSNILFYYYGIVRYDMTPSNGKKSMCFFIGIYYPIKEDTFLIYLTKLISSYVVFMIFAEATV